MVWLNCLTCLRMVGVVGCAIFVVVESKHTPKFEVGGLVICF